MLRPYQLRTVEAVEDAFRRHRSALVVYPTGCGKTIVCAELIKRTRPGRTLFIAHREELIWQGRAQIESLTGLPCDIEMADLHAAQSLFGRAPVVLSTVQTLISSIGTERKRLHRFNPTDFDLLVIDECHHAVANSYLEIIEWFKQNDKLRVLGVTATPDRYDQRALGQVFDTVADRYEILDAIRDGWLVDIQQQFVTIEGLDFSHIKTVAGDLKATELAEVMERERNLQGVAAATINIIGTRKAIVFTASVKQAEWLCEIFNRAQPGMSAWICGATPLKERRMILQRFRSKEIQVVVNCNVLTEGYDHPGVEVIVMARPTKSRALYAQMAGRSMRPLPGIVEKLETAEERRTAIMHSAKPYCLILDFVGNSGRHKLVCSADILGGWTPEIVERAVKKIKESGKALPVAVVLEREAVDVEKEKKRIEEEKARRAARRAGLIASAKYKTRLVDPFTLTDVFDRGLSGWRDSERQITARQRELLLRQGIDPAGLTFDQAQRIIRELFRRWRNNLCTIRQAALLGRFGYNTNMTRDEATQIITMLQRNNWRPIKHASAMVQSQQTPALPGLR